MENAALIELSLEEFRTNVTGAELIYFSGFLTRRHLENWALHGFIEPIGYNDNMRISYTSYDYEKLEYRFGEAINFFVSQNIRHDILNKMIEKFRIEKGFPISIKEKDGQVSDLMPTREYVLAEVFGWHTADPENRALYVGLLRLQGKNNEDAYRIAWKCYGEEIPESFGRSVRHQWERFLDYAEPRGMDRAMLNSMIS